MDQTNPPKPVMDVMPPKPAIPPAAPPSPDANTAPASHQPETVAASQSGSDRSDATPSPVAGGTGGGAPGAPQPSGEHDGEVSASDRTRTSEQEMAVHAAPPLSDDDKAEATQSQTAEPTSRPKPEKQKAHTAASKPRGPGLAIFAVTIGMVGLAALAILVYLNS